MKSLKSILLIILLPFIMPLSAYSSEKQPEENVFTISSGECDLGLLEKLRDVLAIKEMVCVSSDNREIALDTQNSFESIYLIDFNEQTYKKNQKAFRKKFKITCLNGSAISSLTSFFTDKEQKRAFYFNEWSGLATQVNASENLSRLVQKIKAMKPLIGTHSLIIIDNASAYFDPSKEINQSSEELRASVEEISPGSNFYVIGDTLVFTPKETTLNVSPLVKALSNSVTQGYDLLQEQVLETAERSLLSPDNDQEKEVLLQIAKKYASFSPNLEAHTVFFEGLVHLKEQRYLEASNCFHKAIALGYENWKVYWNIAQAEYQRRNIPETKRALKHITKAMPEHKESLQLLEKIDVK